MTPRTPKSIRAWLDPDFAKARLIELGWDVRDVRIGTLRIKGPEEAVLGIDVLPEEGDATIPAMVRVAPLAQQDALADKWTRLKPVGNVLGEGVLHDRDVLVFAWPNDPGLRNLREVADIDRLKRHLASITTLSEERFRIRGGKTSLTRFRWKPERRAVVRVDLAMIDDATGEKRTRSVFVRVFPDTRGIDVLTRLDAYRRAGIAAPLPLGVLLDGTVTVESAVAGHVLFDLFLRKSAESAAERVGRLLGRLHAFDASDLPSTEFDLLEGADAILATTAPDERERFAALQHRLGPPPRGDSLVHGDLHLRQFLMDGDALALVDLERAGRGSAEGDMGLLLANLDDMALRHYGHALRLRTFTAAMLDAWREARGRIDEQALTLARARGLLGLALLPLRRFEPHADALFKERLALAERLITEAAPTSTPIEWELLFPKPKSPWSAVLRDGTPALFDPADGRLTPLPWEQDPVTAPHHDLRHRGELVARRAGNRAVLRLAGPPTTWVKLVARKRASDLATRLEVARRIEAFGGPPFPRVVESFPEEGRFTFEHLPGTPWHDLLMSSGGLPQVDLVVHALKRLHELPADPALPKAGRPTTDEVVAYVRAVFPGWEPAFVDTARRFPPTMPSNGDFTLHGDLHDKNILVDGSVIRLLDPDSLRSGPREEDEGNLSAHVALRALQRGDSGDAALEAARGLEQRILHHSPRPDGGERLVAFRRHTLFRLAAIHLLRRPWSHLAQPLLDLCAR